MTLSQCDSSLKSPWLFSPQNWTISCVQESLSNWDKLYQKRCLDMTHTQCVHCMTNLEPIFGMFLAVFGDFLAPKLNIFKGWGKVSATETNCLRDVWTWFRHIEWLLLEPILGVSLVGCFRVLGIPPTGDEWKMESISYRNQVMIYKICVFIFKPQIC